MGSEMCIRDSNNTERITALEKHSTDVDDLIESIGGDIEGLQQKTAEIEKYNSEDTEAWKKRTDEIEHNAKKYTKSTASNIMKHVEETDAKLSELTTNFTEFSTSTTKNFDEIRKEIQELHADDEALEKDCHSTLDEINRKNSEMKAVIEQSNKKLEDMNNRLIFLQGEEKISMTDLSGQIQTVRKTLNDSVDLSLIHI